MSRNRAAQVFISYCSEDLELATQVTAAFTDAGYSTFFAPQALLSGVDYQEQIPIAIEQCEALVLLLSPAAEKSTDVRREASIASSLDKPILPFILSGLVYPSGVSPQWRYLLHFIQIAPFISPSQVVDVTRGHLSVPAGEPTAPRFPDGSVDRFVGVIRSLSGGATAASSELFQQLRGVALAVESAWINDDVIDAFVIAGLTQAGIAFAAPEPAEDDWTDLLPVLTKAGIVVDDPRALAAAIDETIEDRGTTMTFSHLTLKELGEMPDDIDEVFERFPNAVTNILTARSECVALVRAQAAQLTSAADPIATWEELASSRLSPLPLDGTERSLQAIEEIEHREWYIPTSPTELLGDLRAIGLEITGDEALAGAMFNCVRRASSSLTVLGFDDDADVRTYVSLVQRGRREADRFAAAKLPDHDELLSDLFKLALATAMERAEDFFSAADPVALWNELAPEVEDSETRTMAFNYIDEVLAQEPQPPVVQQQPRMGHQPPPGRPQPAAQQTGARPPTAARQPASPPPAAVNRPETPRPAAPAPATERTAQPKTPAPPTPAAASDSAREFYSKNLDLLRGSTGKIDSLFRSFGIDETTEARIAIRDAIPKNPSYMGGGQLANLYLSEIIESGQPTPIPTKSSDKLSGRQKKGVRKIVTDANRVVKSTLISSSYNCRKFAKKHPRDIHDLKRLAEAGVRSHSDEERAAARCLLAIIKYNT